MEYSSHRKRTREELKKEDIIRFIQDGSAVIEKPNDKRSSIWKKFGHPQLKESGEVLKNFAICSVCSKTYHYDAKSGNTTLNAKKDQAWGGIYELLFWENLSDPYPQ